MDRVGQTSSKDFPGACTISTGGQHLCALQQASGLVVCFWDELLLDAVSNKNVRMFCGILCVKKEQFHLDSN